MDPDAFITETLTVGRPLGPAALDPDQRLVLLLSEAEVFCDMEGIDSFLEWCPPEYLPETADGFAAVGATEIADCFRAIIQGNRDNALLDRLNELLTTRTGYDYYSLRRVIADRLARRSL